MTGAAPHIHRPKVEVFDTVACTNTDPKGEVRAVEEYRREPFGLYVSRPLVGRTNITYLESWLLPGLGIRVTDWWFAPGHERDQDFYIDIASVEVDDSGGGLGRWRTVDHYLDLVLRIGRDIEVLDTDELAAAVAAGYLDVPTAQRTMDTAFTVVAGIAAHGLDLAAWLLATAGITLTWQRH